MNSKEETFEELYQICVPKLMTYLTFRSFSQQDAEDIVSRAAMLLWEKWDDFPTHTPKGMLCWLLNTVRNIAYEEERRMARLARLLNLDELPPHMHPSAPPDTSREQREEEYQQILRGLTARLPEKDRELLLDKIERQKSDDEIAQRMGITVNAVRIRWTRLKERIIQILKNTSDQD